MSELDLKGSIDIAVSGAVSNLGALERAMDSVRKQEAAGTVTAGEAAKALASLATAWERTSRSISTAADAQGRAEVNLSKVASQESARRIAERRAEADAATKSTSQIAAQLKAQQAAEKQLVARSRTTTANPTTTGGATVNRNLAAALGQSDDPQKAQLRDMAAYYAAIEAMDAKSAAERIKNEQRVTQQKAAQNRQSLIQQERDEAAIRKNELSAMRGAATSSLGLPDVGSLNQTRYALYDVSTTLGVLGAALTAGGVAAATFGARYESAFTQVERTSLPTATAAKALKEDLQGLSETIPVGFEQLSSIAALGAQMNIANEDLSQFADTTARYSAVTGVSTDQVATSFGALFELTNTGSGEMENLASAINFVGVKSVATDSEILSLAQNIGASTTQAGFLAQETVGLAGALASLRIQPEQARGVILRLFSDFDKAVSENGTQLEKYASVLGETTQSAAQLWNSEPEVFFDKLLKGLSTADDLNGALRELGITETRESNVLQRLAGNYDTYVGSMQNANQAYKDGTFLGESYSRVADDVAARVQILVNSIQNLMAKAGQSIFPILSPVLSVLTTIVQGLESIPAPVLTVITTLTLLAGGFALLVAGGAALVASGFAVRTALAGLSQQGGTTVPVMQGLRKTVQDLTAALGINTAFAKANSVTIGSMIPGYRAAQAGAAGLSTTVAGSTGAFGAAAGGARAFGTALLGVPILNIVAAMSILVPLAFTLNDALSNSANASKEAGAALLSAGGGLASFQEALRKDTELAGDVTTGYGKMTIAVSDSAKEQEKSSATARENAAALGQAVGANDDLYSSATNVAQALRDETLLVGDNSKAWVANALFKQASQNPGDDPLGKLFGDADQVAAYEKLGIDFRDALSRGLGKDGGVSAVIDRELQAATTKALQSGSVEDLSALNEMSQNLREAASAADGLGGNLTTANEVAAALGVSTDVVEESMGGVAEKSLSAAEGVNALFDSLSVAGGYTGAMDALRDSIDENGYAFDNLSSGGRANIQALGTALEQATTYGATLGLSAETSMAQAAASIGGDVSTVLQALQQIAASNPTAYADLDISSVISKYKQLQQLGIGGALGQASEQSNLNRLISKRDSLQSQLATQQASAAPKRQKAADGSAKKAASDAKKLADSVKTVSEYARDMGTAMREAFDKRFGVQQAIDEVTTKVAAMRDRIAEANEKITSLHADLASLASDRNILEIQLGVATDYGDTTRADAIRAELGQNNVDQVEKQKQLAAATAAASTQLEGNTEAAIANRSAVLGLISSYQGQIEAFAATGASADQVSAYIKTLQGQFERQLTQLGFNQQQVRVYAGTFDVLTSAVNSVPTRKDITITADNSSAMGSLGAVSGRISSISGELANLNAQIAASQANINKGTRAAAIQRDIAVQVGIVNSSVGSDVASFIRRNTATAVIAALQAKLATGNYASGGVITGGQRPANRSVDNTTINAQYGEGIVNLKGMDYLGADGLNAINNQQNPFPPTVIFRDSPKAGNSGTVVVELSPIDRQLIQAGKNVSVVIGRSDIANAANAANFDNSQRGANG